MRVALNQSHLPQLNGKRIKPQSHIDRQRRHHKTIRIPVTLRQSDVWKRELRHYRLRNAVHFVAQIGTTRGVNLTCSGIHLNLVKADQIRRRIICQVGLSALKSDRIGGRSWLQRACTQIKRGTQRTKRAVRVQTASQRRGNRGINARKPRQCGGLGGHITSACIGDRQAHLSLM